MSEFNDDYLWDRSGPPDTGVARLEAVLGGLRHDPATPLSVPLDHAHRGSAWVWSFAAAAAAAVAIAVGGAWLGTRTRPGGQAVEMAPLAGMPRIDQRTRSMATRFVAGSRLETDGRSRARLELPETGLIEVEAGSQLRFVSVQDGVYRFRLERGVIQAFITAPAGRFVVETPASVAVDLGCAYVLTVGEDGGTVLRVSSGLVALTQGRIESFVPVGFVCASPSSVAPCTPYRIDSAQALQSALRQLDAPANRSDVRDTALRQLLAAATADDAVTLWHLLATGGEPVWRAQIYDRLARVSPPPSKVLRDAVLAGDRTMLDAWFDSFGYGALDMWRTLAVALSANK